LFFVFILISIIVSRPLKAVRASLLACTIPFGLALGGYLLFYGLVTGSFGLGTHRRAYPAFEQGQGVAYEHLYTRNAYVEGQVEARRLFGTPEENRQSILNAINRNPTAFLQRVGQTAKKLPRQICYAYGAWLGLVLLFLAVRGAVEMARKKVFLRLGILFAWPVHLLVYFLTFFRPEYFLLPFFVVFSLAAAGIDSVVSGGTGRKERCLWSATLLAVALFEAWANNAALFEAVSIFLLGLWLVWTIAARSRTAGVLHPVGLVLAQSVLLLIRGGPRAEVSDARDCCRRKGGAFHAGTFQARRLHRILRSSSCKERKNDPCADVSLPAPYHFRPGVVLMDR